MLKSCWICNAFIFPPKRSRYFWVLRLKASKIAISHFLLLWFASATPSNRLELRWGNLTTTNQILMMIINGQLNSTNEQCDLRIEHNKRLDRGVIRKFIRNPEETRRVWRRRWPNANKFDEPYNNVKKIVRICCKVHQIEHHHHNYFQKINISWIRQIDKLSGWGHSWSILFFPFFFFFFSFSFSVVTIFFLEGNHDVNRFQT